MMAKRENRQRRSGMESLLSDYDIHLFREGKHYSLYEKLGAHVRTGPDGRDTHFAVWAPNARNVSIIGSFNDWNKQAHPLRARKDSSGIWEERVPGVATGALYKYHIVSNAGGHQVDKGDPYGFYWEVSPRTASVVWDLEYEWQDQEWMKGREQHNSADAPFAIYEVHLGSWLRHADAQGSFLSYREFAPRLADYLQQMDFTHIELLPITEHPFYGSWGYQTLGYFAPTSRYGTPQDFMYLVQCLHQAGIGVILDWVPSHFPNNENGLVYFDGTHLYEHADPRQGFHPEWKSCIFNHGRNEVKSFLISNALFWLDKYHADGLRVDAVASMLYLDYARQEGEWIPNRFGGRENLGAIDFLKDLNRAVYGRFPDVQTIAEESTAWPMVSRPVHVGGLGFGMKWNMGWMHDTLAYFSEDPVHRKYHHNHLTFGLWYAYSENFVLPLSHDEVVYGKGSLYGKMPGDEWQKWANLRLLLGYMWTYPGKKLLFMGGEFGQWSEWNHEESLEWHALEHPGHQGLHKWMQNLNSLYRKEPALYQRDFEPEGFEWVDFGDSENSVISYIRRGHSSAHDLLVVCNFTPVPRENYRVGVPVRGLWQELLNSDAQEYGGVGYGNLGNIESSPAPFHRHYSSLSMTLPPLGVIVLAGPGRQEKASPAEKG